MLCIINFFLNIHSILKSKSLWSQKILIVKKDNKETTLSLLKNSLNYNKMFNNNH